MPGLGDVLAAGAVSLFAGSVVSSQRINGTVSPSRRRVGDGLGYFGLACWLGGPLWWLFYQ